MGCGREPNGFNMEKYGVCPATIDDTNNGINNGTNSGRYCWRVAGTLCDGEPHGIDVKRNGTCISCKFYNHVKRQESNAFVL